MTDEQKGIGSFKFTIDTKNGAPLPGGVLDVSELAGRVIRIVDGEASVILEGTIPEVDCRLIALEWGIPRGPLASRFAIESRSSWRLPRFAFQLPPANPRRYAPTMTKDHHMQRLIDGVHRFRGETFGGYRELFKHLANEGQNPHALFITCSDSRVLAELITHSRPGDLFVVKNVGNIVPPPLLETGLLSTAAAIEFAIGMLGVNDVVLCGHSQCGAMEGLLSGAVNRELAPNLANWLDVAAPVKEVIDKHYSHLTDPQDRMTAAAEENVLFGLENLSQHPLVAKRLAAGTLRLHGWFFKIATGDLFAYDPDSKQFVPLVDV